LGISNSYIRSSLKTSQIECNSHIRSSLKTSQIEYKIYHIEYKNILYYVPKYISNQVLKYVLIAYQNKFQIKY